jgi:translation initiation factor IF-2
MVFQEVNLDKHGLQEAVVALAALDRALVDLLILTVDLAAVFQIQTVEALPAVAAVVAIYNKE